VVEPGAADLLRGHVRELALDDAGLGLDRRADRLGEPEVDQLHLALEGDQDVGRADVAVDDVERLAVVALLVVGVVEALAGAADDVAGLRQRDRAALLLMQVEDAADVAAVDVLEGDVERVLVAAELVDLADVAVLELDRQLGLGLEHRDEVRVAGDVRQDPLDGHRALEVVGAGLLGLVNLGHATGADALEHLIRADTVGEDGSQREPS
jgi:hypothetical protein